MNKIREKAGGFLARHPFFKNIAVLISGNVLGYGINILFLPVISRIYSPGQLGEYDLILSSGRFVMDFISLGLIIAIMLPKEDRKARQLCQLILVLNISFLTILFLFFAGIKNHYRLFDTSIPYGTALLLLAAYLFFFNMQSLYYSYTNRSRQYRILFWNPILQNVVNIGVSVALGLGGKGTAGYLMGTIAAYAVCCMHMQLYVHPFRVKADPIEWKNRIVEYKEIVWIQMPANLIAQAGNEIPTQFLGRMFGSALLGGYTMANRILSIPLSLLSMPINRVFYQTMAEKMNRNEDVSRFCFGIVEKNIRIAILPLGILVVFAKPVIPFVLGSSWKIAGDYIAVLGIMFLLKFCSSCVSGTFVIMGRQKLSLLMSMVNLVKYGMCFGISYSMGWNVFQTVIFFAVMECLFQLLNLFLCAWCTRYSIKAFLLFTIKYIVGGNLLIYGVYFLINRLLVCFA